MGQNHSVPSRWTALIAKDDSGNDCAVLLNPATGTVLELCGISTGWFSFMDRSDQAAIEKAASAGEATSGMRGKYCPGFDASFEYRRLTAAPRVLESLRAGAGEPIGDGWRLHNWSAMQEDAPLILQCRGSPELRLVLTADGFILFPADPGAQALVARRAAVRVVGPDEARREVSGSYRPAAAGNGSCCLPFASAQ